MNATRIASLRQELGWTQERLAAESGVGIRTVQRLEAGQEASLETLSLLAGALRVPVRDLLTAVDDRAPGERVGSPEAGTAVRQAARDHVTSAWRSLYIGVGIVVTLFSFTAGQYGLPLLLSYWGGGYVILRALRTLVIEPRLDERYPLSRGRRGPKAERALPADGSLVETSAGPGR